jgi:hypothetical protein
MLGVVRAAGLDAEPTDPAIEDVPVNDDVTARPVARLRRSLRDMLGRADLELADLRRAIGAFGPDVLLVDTNKYGAAVAAEASGLPWATALPSLLALPGKGIPPYGLGLAPMRGPAGAVRDGLLWPVVVRQYGRAMLPRLNALRAGAGLRELRSPVEHVLAPDRLLVMTGQPLEYPRRDLPGHVRFVGAQCGSRPARRRRGCWRRARRGCS